jgi:peptidoglycan/xylan/chitin deacetylase (PgdA/CDA1 family)
VRYLKRRYPVVPLSQAVDALAGRTYLDRDVVVLTFDDGYAGTYEHAWPILREENVPAAVFVTTGFLDGRELWFDVAERCLAAAVARRAPIDGLPAADVRKAVAAWSRPWQRGHVRAWLKALPPDRRDEFLVALRPFCEPLPAAARPLRWEQVRELRAAGIDIGCHCVSHPILSSLPGARQEEEIRIARDRITTETGAPPRYFAYPNGAVGDFTSETADLVREAGFAAACTTIRVSNRPGCDPFQLGRIGVGEEPCLMLAARLAGLFDEAVRAALRPDAAGRRPTWPAETPEATW